MNNITITGYAGQGLLGIMNRNSYPIMTNVTIDNFCIGIENILGGTVKIDRSIIMNTVRAIRNDSTMFVGTTRIEGTVENLGTIKCVECYNGAYSPLLSSCQ